MNLTLNLTGLHPETARRVIGNIRHEDRAKHALGLIEQLRLKQLHDQMGAACHTDVGRQMIVVSPDQFQRFREAYGDLFWADPDSSKFVWRHHEDMRVKDTGTKIQSGYTGSGKLPLATKKPK